MVTRGSVQGRIVYDSRDKVAVLAGTAIPYRLLKPTPIQPCEIALRTSQWIALFAFAITLFHPLFIARAEEPEWKCADSRIHATLWSANVIRDTQMHFAPDGSLWVIELRGKLKRLVETKVGVEATTILDLGQLANSYDPELGATSLALDPDFNGKTGTLYIAHNWDTVDARVGAVSRITLSESKSPHVTMIYGPIPSAGAHQVDRILLDQREEMLLTTGDAWHPAWAQQDDDPHGKILRLTGFDQAKSADDTKYTVLAKGLRNPFALARRAKDQLLVVANNGPEVDDGLFVVKPKANYGWGASHDKEGIDAPLYRWKLPVSPDGLCFYELPPKTVHEHAWPSEYLGDLFIATFGPTQRPTMDPLERVRQVLRFEIDTHDGSATLRRASAFITPSPGVHGCPLDLTVGPEGDLFMLTYGGTTGSGSIYRLRFDPR